MRTQTYSPYSARPADESSQVLTFLVSNDNSSLFAVQPSIDASGNLSWTLAADANGAATVTVVLADDGGTASGGADTSPAQTFTITVNDSPSFTPGGDVTVDEDAGAQTVPGWATNLSAGPADEVGQTLTFQVSNDHNALFAVQPSINANGQLTYTLAADANGTATVTVALADNGGTANRQAQGLIKISTWGCGKANLAKAPEMRSITSLMAPRGMPEIVAALRHETGRLSISTARA